MPKPQKYTDIFILLKKLFLVGLRVLQSMSNPAERHCCNKYLFSQTRCQQCEANNGGDFEREQPLGAQAPVFYRPVQEYDQENDNEE